MGRRRSVTVTRRQVRRDLIAEGHDRDVIAGELALAARRPKLRGDCEEGERPCPFLGCRHHLYLDVTPAGGVKLNFPDREVWEIPETCALDVAGRGRVTLEGVAGLMNITRERARQIEDRALLRLRDPAAAIDPDLAELAEDPPRLAPVRPAPAPVEEPASVVALRGHPEQALIWKAGAPDAPIAPLSPSRPRIGLGPADVAAIAARVRAAVASNPNRTRSSGQRVVSDEASAHARGSRSGDTAPVTSSTAAEPCGGGERESGEGGPPTPSAARNNHQREEAMPKGYARGDACNTCGSTGPKHRAGCAEDGAQPPQPIEVPVSRRETTPKSRAELEASKAALMSVESISDEIDRSARWIETLRGELRDRRMKIEVALGEAPPPKADESQAA